MERKESTNRLYFLNRTLLQKTICTRKSKLITFLVKIIVDELSVKQLVVYIQQYVNFIMSRHREFGSWSFNVFINEYFGPKKASHIYLYFTELRRIVSTNISVNDKIMLEFKGGSYDSR